MTTSQSARRDTPLQADRAAAPAASTATPPHPGWWLASDGNWYPPQQVAYAPPPPPPAYAPPNAYYASSPSQPAGSNGFGVAALVLGIVGVLFGLIPLTFFFAWLFGALALIFGLVGRGKAKRIFVGKGSSTAGVVLGGIAIALGVVGIAIIGAAVKKVDDRIGTASPSDSTIEQGSCRVDQFGIAKAVGTITNVSGHSHAFSIHVTFRDSSGTQLGTGFDFTDLRDGETASYEAVGSVPDGAESVRCEISAT